MPTTAKERIDVAFHLDGEISTASALIVRLLESSHGGIKSKGWKQNVVAAITADPESADAAAEVGSLVRAVIPDAYMIDVERKHITAYEAEDSHPLDDGKLLLYAKINSCLDFYGWDFSLLRFSASGIVSDVDWGLTELFTGLIHNANNLGIPRKWTAEERRQEAMKRPERVPPARFRN